MLSSDENSCMYSGGSRISRRGRRPDSGASTSDAGTSRENMCENKRTGSRMGGGWRAPGTPPRSANDLCITITHELTDEPIPHPENPTCYILRIK